MKTVQIVDGPGWRTVSAIRAVVVILGNTQLQNAVVYCFKLWAKCGAYCFPWIEECPSFFRYPLRISHRCSASFLILRFIPFAFPAMLSCLWSLAVSQRRMRACSLFKISYFAYLLTICITILRATLLYDFKWKCLRSQQLVYAPSPLWRIIVPSNLRS